MIYPPTFNTLWPLLIAVVTATDMMVLQWTSDTNKTPNQQTDAADCTNWHLMHATQQCHGIYRTSFNTRLVYSTWATVLIQWHYCNKKSWYHCEDELKVQKKSDISFHLSKYSLPRNWTLSEFVSLCAQNHNHMMHKEMRLYTYIIN
jgi:hypothetical protein